jgi:lysophospholipase
LIEELCDLGIACVRFDLRGHGRSSGIRAHVDSFAEYVTDLHLVTLWYETQRAALGLSGPTFLLGHSMGGVVVARYLQEHGAEGRYCGLLLSAPGFLPKVQIPAYKRVLLRLLLPWVPKLKLPTGISASAISTDVDEQRLYLTDPQISKKVSLRWYAEFTREGQTALAKASEITVPIYAFCGAADEVVSTREVQRFVETVTSVDKTYKCWDGLRHETLNERPSARQQVCCAISEWILAHRAQR